MQNFPNCGRRCGFGSVAGSLGNTHNDGAKVKKRRFRGVLPLEVGSSTASVLTSASPSNFADISKKRGFGSGDRFVHRPVLRLSSRSSS